MRDDLSFSVFSFGTARVRSQSSTEDNTSESEITTSPQSITKQDSTEPEVVAERLLTKAERDSFFAPVPRMQPTFTEFQPTTFWQPATNFLSFVPSMGDDGIDHSLEPSYKQKEKTEICKYWLLDNKCKFGNDCAFAHGEHELVKKTHVASKYRQTLCKSFM